MDFIWFQIKYNEKHNRLQVLDGLIKMSQPTSSTIFGGGARILLKKIKNWNNKKFDGFHSSFD